MGEQIEFDSGMVGYLVKIEIDPLEEIEIPYESATYTIRVFKPFYKNGYADFQRSGKDIIEYHKRKNKNL